MEFETEVEEPFRFGCEQMVPRKRRERRQDLDRSFWQEWKKNLKVESHL